MKTIPAALALALLAGAAQAQEGEHPRWGVELQGGAAFPRGGLGTGGRSGSVLGAGVVFPIARHLAVYAGGSQARLTAGNRGTGGTEYPWRQFGADAGFRLTLRHANALTPFVRAGAVFQAVHVGSPEDGAEGDATLGWDVGAGVLVPLGSRLSINPSVGYTDRRGIGFARAQVGVELRP